MAEASMWDKFKNAMTDGMPSESAGAKVKNLDPDKAKAFSSVFNGESEPQESAISRRLKKLTGSY